MAKLVSKTYGEALFNYAMEENTLDQIADEVKVVSEVITQDTELMKFLNHPKITKEEKISVIENVFKGKVSDGVVGFLVIIINKGRYNEFKAIFDFFLGMVREHHNIGVAHVTSAVTLTEEQKDKISKKLLATTKYTQFELSYTVDKSIIGGLIVRIGDRVVDSSIKNQLKNMTKALA